MLDIGFGIGGAAFDFSETYGAVVEGIDINPLGWEKANEELIRRNQERSTMGLSPLPVHFQVEDALHAYFEKESFDVIYSRDTLLHLDVTSKQTVFAKCLDWLKPGGKIWIGDYCLGRNSTATGFPTPNFAKYLKVRGYHMWTPRQYADALETAGFQDSNAEDLALWYCTTCQTELDRVAVPGPGRDDFLSQHGEFILANLEKTYRDKIQMTLRGDRSYVLVTATKEPEQPAQEPRFELRQQVVGAYTKLSTTGYVLGCDGNVSVRVDDKHFLVTPSGVDIPDLDTSKIVLCDQDGKLAQHSKFKPSSETELHTLIYQRRQDVGAIVHSHSIYACALACCQIPLPPAHYAVCELIHDTSRRLPEPHEAVILCSTYHTYGSWNLAVAGLTALGKNHACFLANHGAVVVGHDLEEAMYRTERLERECEIYFRSKQLGRPMLLTGEEIQNVHRRDQSYGQEARGKREYGESLSWTSVESDTTEECIQDSKPSDFRAWV
jgi:L-fuculose-phosphate aldolase